MKGKLPNYLIVIDRDYTVTHTRVSPDTEEIVEFEGSIVVDTMYARSEEEAIEDIAQLYHFDKKILRAYKLEV